MTWWVIVNPTAGRPGEVTKNVKDVLMAHGVEAEIHESQSPGHVKSIIAAGKDAGVRKFAGVGGDGTAHLLLNGLMQIDWETPPGLAILPAGSGSDFIRAFKLPRTIEGMVPHLLSDKWCSTDILRLEGSFGTLYSLNAIEAGVGAAATSSAKRLPRWIGEIRYAIAFWFTLPSFSSGMVEVVVNDDEKISGNAIEIVIANGQFFGGGMNISPKSSVDDGLAEVQVFMGRRRNAFSVMPKIVKGTHIHHEKVQCLAGNKVRLDVPDDWPIEADGEVLGKGDISVSLVPRAIKFKI